MAGFSLIVIFFPFLVAGLIIFVSLILFGIGTVLFGIGGVTASSFIKNKLAKSIMLIIFSIVFALGLLCVSPLIAAFFSLGDVYAVVVAVLGVCVCALGARGFIVSQEVKNEALRLLLRIVFAAASAGGALLVLPLIITLF